MNCNSGEVLEGGRFVHNFYYYTVHSSASSVVVKNDNFCDQVATPCNREAA